MCREVWGARVLGLLENLEDFREEGRREKLGVMERGLLREWLDEREFADRGGERESDAMVESE